VRSGPASRWNAARRALGAAFVAVLWVAVAPAQPAPEQHMPEAGIDSWFRHLRVGVWVKVSGKLTPARVLDATKIKIMDGELDEVDVESFVESVDLVKMTVQTTLGIRVVATPTTDMDGPKHHHDVSFTFLAIGDRVDVEGQLQKDGSLVAEEIEIEKSKRLQPDYEPDNKHEITARIESIDAEKHRIVLLGIPVQLSETTRNKTPLLD
jgi:uncharacterized protein DUF5666